MKKITLKELNEKGQLMFAFKQIAFVRNGDKTPRIFYDNDPTTIYLHFYNGMYIVTSHITTTNQRGFENYEDAFDKFNEVVLCTK